MPYLNESLEAAPAHRTKPPLTPAQASAMARALALKAKAQHAPHAAKAMRSMRQIPPAYWAAVRYKIAASLVRPPAGMGLHDDPVLGSWFSKNFAKVLHIDPRRLHIPDRWRKLGKTEAKWLKGIGIGAAGVLGAVFLGPLILPALGHVAGMAGSAFAGLWHAGGSMLKSLGPLASKLFGHNSPPDVPLDPNQAAQDAAQLQRDHPELSPEQALQGAMQAQALQLATGQRDPQATAEAAMQYADPSHVQGYVSNALGIGAQVDQLPAEPIPPVLPSEVPAPAAEEVATIPKNIAAAGFSGITGMLIGVTALATVVKLLFFPSKPAKAS